MDVYYYHIPEKQNTFFLAGDCSGTKVPAVVWEEMNGGSGRCQELGCWQGWAGFEGERWAAAGEKATAHAGWAVETATKYFLMSLWVCLVLLVN
jgi:hypothetical protein